MRASRSPWKQEFWKTPCGGLGSARFCLACLQVEAIKGQTLDSLFCSAGQSAFTPLLDSNSMNSRGPYSGLSAQSTGSGSTVSTTRERMHWKSLSSLGSGRSFSNVLYSTYKVTSSETKKHRNTVLRLPYSARRTKRGELNRSRSLRSIPSHKCFWAAAAGPGW